MSQPTFTTDLSAEEAFNSLTYWEIQDLKKFGVNMADLEELAVEAMYGLVWVVQRRTDPSFSPKTVKDLTMGQIVGFFAADQPESEAEGKDVQPDSVS